MGRRSDRGGRVYLALAYGMAAVCIGGLGYGFYLMLGQAHGSSWVIPIVVGGVAAVAGMGFTFGAVLKRSGVAGEHILFHTWFPLFMGLVPLAGPIFALWGAFVLLRGKVGAATISTSSGGSKSTRHHDAQSLNGTGLPGGVILLVLTLLQPLLLVVNIVPEGAADFLGIAPIVNTWDGSTDLDCDATQVYRAEGCKAAGVDIDLRDRCQLDLAGCELDLKQPISVQDFARLTIRGGRLQASGFAIDAKEKARVVLEDLTVLAPNSIRARGESTVFISGGLIHGKTALRAEGRAVITLRGVERLGKVSTGGDGVVHPLAEGETPEEIVVKARNAEAWEKMKKERIEAYQPEACKGFIECYQRNGVKGEVKGSIVMKVGDSGSVIKVKKLSIRRTTPEAQACIRNLAETKRIANFGGPTGWLSCSYSGTVTPQSRMVDVTSHFRPDKKSDLYREKVE